MRILFISNFYPPHYSSGGLELSCQEMVEGLKDRGHQIRVLTSRALSAEVHHQDPPWVQRTLHLEMEFASFVNGLHFFSRRKQREQENLTILRRCVDEFQPDIIFIWGMWNLPRSTAALAEQLLPQRVVYYIADYWPTLPGQYALYWQQPAKSAATRLPKAVLRIIASAILSRERLPALRFPHVIFVSRFLQQEYARLGITVGESRAIAGAIDTTLFLKEEPAHQKRNGGLSLLYAGRFSPEKGIETAILAMDELVNRRGIDDVCLKLVGGGDSSYETRLREQVRSAGLESHVVFHPPVPKDAMPDLYPQADAVLFPSIWQEPFGRVVVEAMASGTVVIGTATGGAAEVLVDGENGLVFPPGDHLRLAEQILKLRAQPELRRRLVENGRRTAVERFDNRRMVAEIEAYLESLLTPAAPAVELR